MRVPGYYRIAFACQYSEVVIAESHHHRGIAGNARTYRSVVVAAANRFMLV